MKYLKSIVFAASLILSSLSASAAVRYDLYAEKITTFGVAADVSGSFSIVVDDYISSETDLGPSSFESFSATVNGVSANFKGATFLPSEEFSDRILFSFDFDFEYLFLDAVGIFDFVDGAFSTPGTYFTDPLSGFKGTLTVSQIANPVPEPSTYALMFAGLGVVGWATRRRSPNGRN